LTSIQWSDLDATIKKKKKKYKKKPQNVGSLPRVPPRWGVVRARTEQRAKKVIKLKKQEDGGN